MTRPTTRRARARLRSPRCRRCGGPWGRERFYAPDPLRTALAGQTVKFSMKRTVGCDRCWRPFAAVLRSHMEAALSAGVTP